LRPGDQTNCRNCSFPAANAPLLQSTGAPVHFRNLLAGANIMGDTNTAKNERIDIVSLDQADDRHPDQDLERAQEEP
jgi:hypothetical protein